MLIASIVVNGSKDQRDDLQPRLDEEFSEEGIAVVDQDSNVLMVVLKGTDAKGEVDRVKSIVSDEGYDADKIVIKH